MIKSIINQSATGLLSVNEQGRVININPAAEKLTGLIAFHHINTLARIHTGLPDFILKAQDLYDTPSTIFENRQGQKLLFKISEIRTPAEIIKIVVVSDITKELDVREVDAWIRLARTLSHEIMNNIAPITTLSQMTLDFFVRNGEAVDADRYDKIKVEQFLPDSVHAVTDDNLLSQVLINLVKNALESFDEQDISDPCIRIRVSEDGSYVRIDISNNGGEIPLSCGNRYSCHSLQQRRTVPA